MNPFDTIREQAAKLLVSDDPETVRKGAELLKVASDLELQQANTAKLEVERKKVEQDLSSSLGHWKDFLTSSVPLVTTIILAGTFIFQIIQNRQADTEKRAELVRQDQQRRDELIRQDQQREDAKFTDALKLIQNSEHVSPAATILNTFTKEPQKTEARQMALKLLLRSESMDDFRDVFLTTIEPVGPADLPILAQLDRSFASRLSALPSTYNPATRRDDPLKVAKLDAKTRNARGLVTDEIVFLSQRITLILQRLDEKTSGIDLSDMAISTSDMKGANLHNADLSNAAFTSVRMDGCDFGGVTKFQDAQFFYTAWWHAARISQPLLQYLEKTAPYWQGTEYPGATPETAEGYKQNVSRLESSLGQS